IDKGGRNLIQRYQAALLPGALKNSTDELGLELHRIELLAAQRIAHRDHRVARPERKLDRLAGEVGVGIGEAVGENDQTVSLFIQRIFAAHIDLPGRDAMVVQTRETLEKPQVVQALTGIDEAGIGIDTRGDIPALARKARNDFVLQRVIVTEKLIQ